MLGIGAEGRAATVMQMLKWARRRRDGRRHVVIIVQHLPVPLDRRIWFEARALVAAGYRVSVICTKAPGDPAFEVLEGVELYKYAAAPKTKTRLSFIYEFAYCWLRAAGKLAQIHLRHGVDAVQACNPPDTYFPLAAPFKLMGKPFVYDQRDLCPEMYSARFGRQGGALLGALRALEQATYRLADHVVAPNESYRAVAMSRGRKPPNDVTVVRGGPDLKEMPVGVPDPALKNGRRHLCCFVGVMGPQDHVDIAVRAAHHFVTQLGRDDCQFALLGFGDCLDELRELTARLAIDDYVTFTGMANLDLVTAYLSTADVGLVPDLKTPYSDASTLTKVMEYMHFSVPVVGFDLAESRVSAGAAAMFVPSGDVTGFAEAIAVLLDDPAKRAEMGRAGRQRMEDALAWQHQAPPYVAVYDRLLGRQ